MGWRGVVHVTRTGQIAQQIHPQAPGIPAYSPAALALAVLVHAV
jgi:hypothetical protein